jgi:hypothetical protein
MLLDMWNELLDLIWGTSHSNYDALTPFLLLIIIIILILGNRRRK